MGIPVDSLDERERRLWREYERLEETGLRAAALETLARFVDAVRSYAPDRRKMWVEEACHALWDDYDPVAIIDRADRPFFRFPLAADLILPVLIEGYRAREPYHARWLGQFALSSVVLGSGLMAPDVALAGPVYQELRSLGLGELTPEDLLREALTLDSSDWRAAHTLIGCLEETFDYWTHELPDFVLADDTAEWRAKLDEFERLVERYPTARDFEFELRFWRFHCDAWEEYVDRDAEFGSYQAFLAQRDS